MRLIASSFVLLAGLAGAACNPPQGGSGVSPQTAVTTPVFPEGCNPVSLVEDSIVRVATATIGEWGLNAGDTISARAAANLLTSGILDSYLDAYRCRTRVIRNEADDVLALLDEEVRTAWSVIDRIERSDVGDKVLALNDSAAAHRVALARQFMQPRLSEFAVPPGALPYVDLTTLRIRSRGAEVDIPSFVKVLTGEIELKVRESEEDVLIQAVNGQTLLAAQKLSPFVYEWVSGSINARSLASGVISDIYDTAKQRFMESQGDQE